MSKPVGRFSGNPALLASAALGWALIGAVLLPQAASAEPVVQPLPSQSAGMKLNDALGQLARNPQDLEALIAAGRASLELGDVQAAIGFFQRADTLWPGSVRVKAGLAGAYALSADPITAIGMFKEVEKLGPIDAERLSDRGLAYDLVGDNQTAQTYYRQSLGLTASDETSRRLGLSQAISGDRAGMERTLGPLLQRQDKAAWRTRAFALAILGVPDEAESIVHQTMPEDMATSMTGYLRYMPKLTPAQQAAAANLGQFPRAAEIGHDDPRFAAYARPHVVLAVVTPVPVPGKNDGKSRDKGKPKDRDKGKQLAAATLPPVPSPPVSREVDFKPPQLAMATPVLVVPKPAPLPAPVPTPIPAPVRAAEPVFASVDPAVARSAVTFDLPPQSRSAERVFATPAPKPPVAKASGESIDEAFADFTPPSREVEPQAGAVDLRHLDRATKPAIVLPAMNKKAADKAKPADKTKPDDKAKPGDKTKDKAKDGKLTQPSRVWVQVATGRDKAGLGSDWRRMVKDDPAVFKGKKPFLTAWGQSNRLLAGPFESQKEAAAFLAALKKAGVSGVFAWTSAAGQVVDPLGGGK
jgi:Flp pilus assembly protein TadD